MFTFCPATFCPVLVSDFNMDKKLTCTFLMAKIFFKKAAQIGYTCTHIGQKVDKKDKKWTKRTKSGQGGQKVFVLLARLARPDKKLTSQVLVQTQSGQEVTKTSCPD